MRRRGYEFEKVGLSGGEYPEASSYWYAMDHERTVLAVTRSVNTTLALIDGLPDLLHDRRVQVLFTVMPRQRDANFERWMRKLVREAGVREIDWEQAVGQRFDLVVTASYEGTLNELSGDVVILNHGTGVGKYLALPPDGRLPVSDDGESTTTMVLSHSEQRRYYAQISSCRRGGRPGPPPSTKCRDRAAPGSRSQRRLAPMRLARESRGLSLIHI